MYEYKATITRVIDGDTVEADVDLGFDVHHRRILRLLGINAPELHAKDPAVRARAKASKDYLEKRVVLDAPADLVVRTVRDKSEKYGRMLATVLVAGVDINKEILDKGLAVAFMVEE